MRSGGGSQPKHHIHEKSPPPASVVKEIKGARRKAIAIKADAPEAGPGEPGPEKNRPAISAAATSSL